MKDLHRDFVFVPPVAIMKDMEPPKQQLPDSLVNTQVQELDIDDDKTHEWLEKVKTLLSNRQRLLTDISWSAFFASQENPNLKPPAITSLLPLFRDTAHTPAMIKHGMDIIEKITQAVNPGQTPVLTVDQPLYAIAKKIQWKWPDQYGENKFVVLMGGLHIEMAVLKVLGDWLNKSGWTYLISAANVTTEARAEHLLQGSNVSLCQWVHQVTAAALHTLMYSSYGEYKDCTPEPHLCFQD